jgi:AraC-like DNA-binding protein
MVITGNELELPLLIQAATVRSCAAERLVWHSHEGVELIFVLAGATAYQFEGGRALTLSGGHFLVVPAHARHRGLDNVRMPSKLVGLMFDLQRIGKAPVVPFTRAERKWILACFEASGGGVYPFGPTLREVVQHLQAEMAAWVGTQVELAQKASLRTLVCASILEAAREVARRPVERSSQMVAAAVEYLRAHFDERLQVGALTRHLGFGRAHFFDLFTSGTGLTPHSYLVRLRLEKATELLWNTRRSITEIALATGFGSGQHFSRVFRKYRDETPNECRKSTRARKGVNSKCSGR